MSTAKIEFSLGSLSFSGEGDEAWVAAQLDKVLAAAPTLSTSAKHQEPAGSGAMGGSGATVSNADSSFTSPLAKHIKEKGGESKQVKRFLATADWLRRRGTAELTTAAVSKALSANHQKGLANAADCLNQNIAKGFCEKTGSGFFITPDGLKDLGYTE
jgi:hypothetical protein